MNVMDKSLDFFANIYKREEDGKKILQDQIRWSYHRSFIEAIFYEWIFFINVIFFIWRYWVSYNNLYKKESMTCQLTVVCYYRFHSSFFFSLFYFILLNSVSLLLKSFLLLLASLIWRCAEMWIKKTELSIEYDGVSSDVSNEDWN